MKHNQVYRLVLAGLIVGFSPDAMAQDRSGGILSRPAPAGSIRAFFGAPVIENSEESFRNEQRRQWRQQRQWREDQEMRMRWHEMQERQREFRYRTQ